MADRTLSILFQDQDDFNFNSSLVEVISNRGALKDQTPVGVTFYAPYTNNEDAAYSGGDGSGTLVGGATVSGGELITTGFDGKYCTYDAEDNANSAQTLCIRIRWKAPYTGAPGTDNHIVNINKGDGTLNNLIQFYHHNSGQLSFGIYEDDGSSVFNANLGVFSPVKDSFYEFDINIDITTGATRVFIDGVQIGSTQTGTGTRNSANIGRLSLGTNHSGTGLGSNKYTDVLIFDTVQHTANYTPTDWSEIPATKYVMTAPAIYYDTLLRHQGIVSITSVVSVSGSDLVYYTVTKDGTEYYYDTVNGEWAVTTGYPDVNTIAEINANISTFITDGLGVSSYIKAYLYSDDGSTTPEITSLVIVYDFYGAAIDDASLCTVYGYIRVNNVVVSGAIVTISPSSSIALYDEDSGEILKSYMKTTDANGYFEQDLPTSVNMDITYSIAIHYVDSNGKNYHREYDNLVIPNQDNVNYAELI